MIGKGAAEALFSFFYQVWRALPTFTSVSLPAGFLGRNQQPCGSSNWRMIRGVALSVPDVASW